MHFLVALMIALNMRKFKLALYQLLSVMVKNIAIGMEGSPLEIVLHGRRCGLLHWLHASVKYCEYNEDLIFFEVCFSLGITNCSQAQNRKNQHNV